ncbi:hypothetical protein FRC06_003464 [Ceratobasidium sp. 370]|nr:hypothetical protein FRC06_003464 [Ceratobasidium sp. 370]
MNRLKARIIEEYGVVCQPHQPSAWRYHVKEPVPAQASTMMTYQPNAHRIFDFPELIDLISKSTFSQDQARLLRVSRTFLNVVAPLVWENVVGVEHLLKLLPGVTVTIKASDKLLPRTTVAINVDSLIVNSDSDRFDYYAPFVKYLEVYPSNGRNYQVLGWRRLLTYAQNHNLLPSLVRLTLSSFPVPSHDQFLWIQTFLSSSLNTIKVIPDPVEGFPEISSLVAGSLLGQIINNCPNVQNLSLFPSTVPPYSSEINGYVIADFCDKTFYSRLHSLRLTELGCTTQILTQEWIHVLEGLPLLERLEVYSITADITVPKLLSPPTLKHFGLYATDWDEVEKIWALNIFATLTSVAVSLRDHDDFDLEFNDSWGRDFIALICSQSPTLTSISIDFGPAEYALNNLSPLASMAKLPLATACFKSLSSMRDEVVENMASVFPMVTKLEFYDMVFTFDELIHFAKLPHLQHLVIGLAGDTRDIKLGLPLPASRSLHTLEICYDVDVGPNLSLLAQYLLSLWPNLQRVIWPELQKTPREARTSELAASVAESLNGFITLHRNFDRLRSRIVAEYGIDVLDRLSR